MSFVVPFNREKHYRVTYEDPTNPALQLTLPEPHDVGTASEEEHLALLAVARQIGPDAVEAVAAILGERTQHLPRQVYREAVLTLIDWEYLEIVPLFAKRKEVLLQQAMEEARRVLPTNHRFPTAKSAQPENNLGDWWPRYRRLVWQESVKGWRGLYAEDESGEKHPIPCDEPGRDLIAEVSDARVDFVMRWAEALANDQQARVEAERQTFRAVGPLPAGLPRPELSRLSESV